MKKTAQDILKDFENEVGTDIDHMSRNELNDVVRELAQLLADEWNDNPKNGIQEL